MKLLYRLSSASSFLACARRPAARRACCTAEQSRRAITTSTVTESQPPETETKDDSNDTPPKNTIADTPLPVGIGRGGKPTSLQQPILRRPYLPGQTAIITGGSRGIGFAIAFRLALEGIACILVGRNEATLKKSADSLPALPPLSPNNSGPDNAQRKHSYLVGDVTESSLWGELFTRTVHILVNAAGISQNSVLPRTTPSEIHHVLDVNLYGTILGCRAALRQWVKTRGTARCIINISSLLAVRGGYGASAYAASKAGVVGLTRAIAEEVSGRRIRANVILPGYIHTDMIANLPKRQLEEMKERIPVRRFGTPDDVADAAMFLIKNGYANNCVLNLDGGLSAAA